MAGAGDLIHNRRSMTAVALLSGGLDSTVAFALRARSIALAVTVDYGQRAARREIAAARAIARRYGVPHRVHRLPMLARLTRTALVDRSRKLPSPALDDRAATRAGFMTSTPLIAMRG